MFDSIADKRITQPDDQNQQHHAKRSPRAAFPDQKGSHHGQRREEENIPAGERHDRVKDRIAQGQIDETEQAGIQCLQPMHRRNNVTQAGQLQ